MEWSGPPPQDTADLDLDQEVLLSCDPAVTPLSAWTHCISLTLFNVLIYKMEINNIINNRPYQKEVWGGLSEMLDA